MYGGSRNGEEADEDDKGALEIQRHENKRRLVVSETAWQMFEEAPSVVFGGASDSGRFLEMPGIGNDNGDASQSNVLNVLREASSEVRENGTHSDGEMYAVGLNEDASLGGLRKNVHAAKAESVAESVTSVNAGKLFGEVVRAAETRDMKNFGLSEAEPCGEKGERGLDGDLNGECNEGEQRAWLEYLGFGPDGE